MKISKEYARNLVIVALLCALVLLQKCKKDTAQTLAAARPPAQGMYALINDTAWTATTVSASLQYMGLSTGKIFTCRGTMGNKVIQIVTSQRDANAGSGFPLGPANGTSTSFGYYILPIHLNLTEQNPTPGTEAGTSLVITAIDTGKRLISGTFAFPARDSIYDAFGNLILVVQNQINNGFFKKIPYSYTP